MILARKIIQIPEFLWYFPAKINKIPEFYMIFARKMPEFYIIIAQKNFSWILGDTCPPCPCLLCLWSRKNEPTNQQMNKHTWMTWSEYLQ